MDPDLLMQALETLRRELPPDRDLFDPAELAEAYNRLVDQRFRDSQPPEGDDSP